MYRKKSVPVRLVLILAIPGLVLTLAATAQAYRICTVNGEVVGNGWRSMMVKTGSQCSTVNVGWRTKYIPNRRPCVGERVSVDFVLVDGHMKATKVVSLTPRPAPVRCYPPPPPPGTVCRQVSEKAPEVCRPAKPICSRTPPPHVTDKPLPSKKRVAKPETTKKVREKPETGPERVTETPSAREPAPERKPEEKRPAPVEDKVYKTIVGEVVASSPKSLSIRVTEEGTTDVLPITVGLKTKFIPFRRPAVGEKVQVEYRVENGGKFGYTVKVVQ